VKGVSPVKHDGLPAQPVPAGSKYALATTKGSAGLTPYFRFVMYHQWFGGGTWYCTKESGGWAAERVERRGQVLVYSWKVDGRTARFYAHMECYVKGAK
jgi:hypothetical protein